MEEAHPFGFLANCTWNSCFLSSVILCQPRTAALNIEVRLVLGFGRRIKRELEAGATLEAQSEGKRRVTSYEPRRLQFIEGDACR